VSASSSSGSKAAKYHTHSHRRTPEKAKKKALQAADSEGGSGDGVAAGSGVRGRGGGRGSGGNASGSDGLSDRVVTYSGENKSGASDVPPTLAENRRGSSYASDGGDGVSSGQNETADQLAKLDALDNRTSGKWVW